MKVALGTVGAVPPRLVALTTAVAVAPLPHMKFVHISISSVTLGAAGNPETWRQSMQRAEW
jgi:hypothetical protein